ncbi:MAG: ABC transporter transmembrane domain-containing protein [Candidatus Caldatribacteriaceae bacterium]
MLLAVAVQILIFLYLLKRGFPLFVVVQKMVDRMNMVIRENLAGVRVVRSFVRSLWEKSQFHSVNQKLMETTVHAFLPIIIFMPLAMLCMNFSLVTVLWFGGFF